MILKKGNKEAKKSPLDQNFGQVVTFLTYHAKFCVECCVFFKTHFLAIL
jgi:hypothetical protein